MFLRLSAILALGLLACAAPAPVDEARYFFPDLEPIEEIRHFELDAWQPIDDRTLFVQTSPSRHYLVVLRSSLVGLRSAEGLIVSSTGRSVRIGFDTVATARAPRHRVAIQGIFRIEREQRESIRRQIRGE